MSLCEETLISTCSLVFGGHPQPPPCPLLNRANINSRFCPREYRCRFTNTDTMLFCMRVMVGVIILYDHVHPVGAFAKTSKIDVSTANTCIL